MEFTVVASKFSSGKSREGKDYAFSRVWVELDDNTLYEMRVPYEVCAGDIISCRLVSYGNGLRLYAVNPHA